MNYPELQFAAAVRKLAGQLQRAERGEAAEKEWNLAHPVSEYVPEALSQIKATLEQIKELHRNDVSLNAPF